ncbi:MAG TPA: gliding motility lipoprotein GldD [Draconibacterium sp.]|nr:gliding motility lipoprotein GldD [Draconibacterium sp.]
MNSLKKIGYILILILLIFGCNEKYTPKPREYFRIDFPEKSYHQLPSGFPYQFDVPDYSKIVADVTNPDKPYWINISVPANKAEVHISYYNLSNQETSNRVLLNKFMEDSRTLAYKHSLKADAIQEQVFMNPGENVYGLIYRIEGNAASPMQFFLTDSTNHFLRGALYIREVPNIDSLKPVIDFLEPDIIRLIETTTWN